MCMNARCAPKMFHVASRATPNVQLQQEQARLQNDCKRLVAMLETTSEYQHWMSERAALKGVHYIPIAECLASEGITSDVYTGNTDRVVRASACTTCK